MALPISLQIQCNCVFDSASIFKDWMPSRFALGLSKVLRKVNWSILVQCELVFAPALDDIIYDFYSYHAWLAMNSSDDFHKIIF